MKAGFGKTDITPRVGVEMFGFGPYRNRKSIGVRDILEARTAVFECGGKTVVLVSLDLGGIYIPEVVAKIRALIRKKHPGLQDQDIMINTSHTHSGPAVSPCNNGWGVTDPPWVALLPGKVAASADQAFSNLDEVKVSQAEVPCRHMALNRVYDRDAPPLEEVLKEDWEPAKPELTDTVCRVIRFDSPEGKLRGFMAYFGCHPVVCCASNRYIHGDYPGVAMHTLMREFPGSVGMFLQGAEGDVNSACVHKGEQESLLALDVFAGRFSNAVRNGLNQAQELKIDSIQSVSKVFSFSANKGFTKEKLLEIRKEKEAVLDAPDAREEDYKCQIAAVYLQGIERCLEKLERGESAVQAELHIIRLGPLQFMGAPFEIMQAIKNDIVSASSAPYPMVMSLTNGVLGYAPDNGSLQKQGSSCGDYAAFQTPLIFGHFPFADIHNEMVRFMLELEKTLGDEK